MIKIIKYETKMFTDNESEENEIYNNCIDDLKKIEKNIEEGYIERSI